MKMRILLLKKTTKSNSNPKKLGRTDGSRGTTRPVPAPEEIVEVKLERCPDCHKRLGRPVKIERRIIEEIPEHQPVRVIECKI